MARDHLSRFSKGRRGISNVFKRSYKLRKYLSTKDRKQAIDDLHKYSTSGGISARLGTQGYKSGLETVYGKWRRDRKDRINRAEARMIKRELEKYQGRMERDPRHKRTSRAYFKEHTHPAERSRDLPLDRSRDVPQPGGDVRAGSFSSSDYLPKGPVQPRSFDGGFDSGSDGGFDGNIGPSEGSEFRDF